MKKQQALLAFLAGLMILMASCGQQLSNSTPEDLGLSSDTLALASQKMQKFIDDGKLAGIATLVMKEGMIVQREQFGFADIEKEQLVEENTIFRIFSMTKPITAAALMSLYDEGKFELDDKLSRHIPEFTDVMVYNDETQSLEPQIEELTIRHLLTHTSGIVYGWGQSYVDSLYRVTGVGGWDSATIGDKVKIMTGLPLKFQPGTAWEYGLSIDVAGYLVEVLSGVPLDEYFKSRIFDPLHMDDTGFYVPEEKHDRFTQVYSLDEEGDLKTGGFLAEAFKKPAVLFSGGGGLVSTMDDYLDFCRMLLNGGTLNGVKILEESTVKLIMSDQLPETASYSEGNGYGLAGQVNLESGEYSWAGAASTNFWIDPSEQMIIITYAQLMPSDHSYAYVFKDLVNRALIKK
ncbi:MAG: beta-lactamase family protein [Bacteroidales bacterium]|nr:beta-lactamase family protein [Bacteroidales bacterium]